MSPPHFWSNRLFIHQKALGKSLIKAKNLITDLQTHISIEVSKYQNPAITYCIHV